MSLSESVHPFPLGSLAITTATATAAAAVAGILYLYHDLPPMPKTGPERPKLVLDALAAKEPIYYLAIGSNLSRKKLETRSVSGEKINFMSMEPCVIHGYRLAFNMRGFPPLEPAMGGVEPLPSFCDKRDGNAANCNGHATTKVKLRQSDSKPLKAYESEECHGALIKLSAHDYEQVYKSEGGGSGNMQGYEEIIVTCTPYDKSHPPVQAVAFRVREHVRMKQDQCPSKRYMNIIREGASELGLKECYQKWLEDHPVQEPSRIIKKMAVNSMMVTITLAMGLNIHIIGHVQSSLLFKVYILPTEPRWKQILGEIAAGIIIFPTACIGFFFRSFLEFTGLIPPPLKKWLSFLE